MFAIKSHRSSQVFNRLPISAALYLTAVLIAILAAEAGFAKITKGPLLLRVYKDRAALMWETDVEGIGKLSYGEGQRIEKHIETVPEQIKYEERQEEKTVFIHKTWIEKLQPGQVYSYRVADAETESKTYSFRTQPVDTNEVTFIVYGDNRSYPETHRKLVELMIKKNVDFVVNSGDLVANGWDYRLWQREFFEPLKGLAESVPIYAVKGNHDRSKPNYYEKLLIPDGERNNFGFNYGPVHYFCADNVTKDIKPAELLKAIAGDAQSSKAQWKFVSYHFPSLNFGGHWSDWGYPDALAAFAEAGVDFVITGHSHQYERFKPVAPPAGTDGNYVTYVTSGGGGAELYDLEPTCYHTGADKIHHFCLFHIKANKLTMDVIDINGRVVDHLEITKTDGGLNKEYLQTAIPAEAVRMHQDLHRTQPIVLSARFQKNQPFTVRYTLSVPALTEPAKVTFKLRGDNTAFQLPEPKILTIPKGGGAVNVELTAVALVEVMVPTSKRGKLKPITPALWLDCHYQIGRIKQDISLRVVAKSEKSK